VSHELYTKKQPAVIASLMALLICTDCHQKSEWASQPEKTSLKPAIFVFQNRLRLSMLEHQESSSALLVMISGESVLICNRSRAKSANSGKVTIFQGVSLWGLRSSLTQLHEFCHKKIETLRYHTMKTRSLRLTMGLNRYGTGTWQTSRRRAGVDLQNNDG